VARRFWARTVRSNCERVWQLWGIARNRRSGRVCNERGHHTNRGSCTPGSRCTRQGSPCNSKHTWLYVWKNNAVSPHNEHRRSLTIVSKNLGIALDASNLSANAESVPQTSVEVHLTCSVGETIDTTQPSWAPAAYVACCVVFVCILQHIKVCARPHVAPSVHKQSFPPAVKRTIVSPSPDVYVWLNSTYIIRI
jgi:hypothetical protein